MKHDAVLGDRGAGPAAPPGSDCSPPDSRDRPLRRLGLDAASEAFEGYVANYAKGALRHVPSGNLKQNIYYKAQDFARGARRARGRRGLSRAAFRFTEAAGDEGELVGLEVNTEPGMSETLLVPEIAVLAGSSFDEPLGWVVEDASCDV
jgi:D-alanine-D-alanine ligase